MLIEIGSSGAQNMHGDSSATTNAETSLLGYLELAQYWAPEIYQATDSRFYIGDYITKFNFDGDYNGRNNWDSLSNYSTVPAYVCYAVSETQTHLFINYSFFHPRDWVTGFYHRGLDGINTRTTWKALNYASKRIS